MLCMWKYYNIKSEKIKVPIEKKTNIFCKTIIKSIIFLKKGVETDEMSSKIRLGKAVSDALAAG